MDDLEAVWKATNTTLEKSGVALLSLDVFRREFELPFRPFYERYTPHVEESQLESWYVEAFHQEQDSIKPFAHSSDFLKYCHRQGIAMFVLSSIHENHFEQHLKIARFGRYFRETYVGVRDKRDKIQEILESHRMVPEETLFVGDMQHDIDAAKHGGTLSCGVLTGFNTLQQLQDRRPDLIVKHLGELQRLLQSHQGSLPGTSNGISGDSKFPISTVGALIFDSSERVLMIQTHKWSNKWGIPGGKIQHGETAEDALRREIGEETNITIKDIQFVMVQDAIRPPEFYRPAHFLLLNYTCRAVPPLETRLNHEAQSFEWVPIEQALEMDLNIPTRKLIDNVKKRTASTCIDSTPI